MEKERRSLYEAVMSKAGSAIREHKVPLAATWIVGLLAHMFMFTNKLLNHDEIVFLFGKGATLESGRWMLAATELIFPNVSMPWIYGVIALAITSLAVCLIIRLLDIRSKIFQALLAGLIVSFPAQTSIFCFMFTSAPYALAFLGSVLSVYIYIIRGSLKSCIASSVALALTLGIYQGYIAVASSLYIILMIQALLKGEPAGKVFKDGLRYAAALLAALGLYYAVTLVICRLSGTELLSYGYSGNSILFRVLLAYSSFLRTLFSGYFGYVNGTLSVLAHVVCIAAGAWLVIRYFIVQKRAPELALAAVCAVLLPLSINALYLIAQTGIISTWTQYSFVCVYVLLAVIFDRFCENVRLRDVVCAALTAVVVINIFFANKVYLKLFMDYENAFAYYTVLASDIKKSPDYSENKRVCIAGTADDGVQTSDELGLGLFTGPANDLINVYSKELFIKNYIGSDIDMVAFEEYKLRSEIESLPEYKAMPAYPAEGSIAEIDGYLVVKLG